MSPEVFRPFIFLFLSLSPLLFSSLSQMSSLFPLHVLAHSLHLLIGNGGQMGHKKGQRKRANVPEDRLPSPPHLLSLLSFLAPLTDLRPAILGSVLGLSLHLFLSPWYHTTFSLSLALYPYASCLLLTLCLSLALSLARYTA